MLKKLRTKIGEEKVRGEMRFVLTILDPFGKRTRKFFNSRRAAKEAEKIVWLDYNEYGANSVNLSHEDRLRFIALDRKCRESGTTLENAAETGLRHISAPDPVPLEKAFKDYLQSKVDRRCRARTIETVRSRIGQLCAAFEPETMCHDVTTDRLREMIHRNGWEPMTMKNRMVEYRAFFKWMMRRRHIATDPTDGLDRVIVDPTPPGVLEPEQLRTLLDWCWKNDKGMAGWIAIGAFCGLRPSEINHIQMKNVNLESRVLLVEKTKIRDNRYVDIPENCIPWLVDIATGNTRKRFEDARKATGLWSNWPNDALRNSCASYYAALFGVDKSRDRLGHKGDSRTFFVHYRVPVLKEKADKWFGIEPQY